jgi:hypothetical protein
MTIESATYINGLTSTNPAAGDIVSEGDDHIRLLKSTIKATFPNVSGAISATHTELNYVAGATSAIQTQINTKATIASPTFTGTPLAPTAAFGTNNTQLATTNFVTVAIGSYNPGAVGSHIFARTSSVVTTGETQSGVSMQAVGITAAGAQVVTGVGLSGTWRCAGHTANTTDATLFVRIA